MDTFLILLYAGYCLDHLVLVGFTGFSRLNEVVAQVLIYLGSYIVFQTAFAIIITVRIHLRLYLDEPECNNGFRFTHFEIQFVLVRQILDHCCLIVLVVLQIERQQGAER